MERLAGWMISEPTNYQLFSGEISRIAPISESSSGVVNYEVTIRLKDLEIEDGVRPGMTAVATILSDGVENAWLVPSSALIEFEGGYYVRVAGDGQSGLVAVTPGTVPQRGSGRLWNLRRFRPATRSLVK